MCWSQGPSFLEVASYMSKALCTGCSMFMNVRRHSRRTCLVFSSSRSCTMQPRSCCGTRRCLQELNIAVQELPACPSYSSSLFNHAGSISTQSGSILSTASLRFWLMSNVGPKNLKPTASVQAGCARLNFRDPEGFQPQGSG